MLCSFVLALLPLLLLAVACGGGDDSVQEQPTDAVDTSAPADDSSVGDSLFAGFNPLELLEAFGGGSLTFTREIDPTIEPVLIRPEDLPAEFSSVADFAESVSSDVGEVEIAGRVFSTGDLKGGDLDDMASMVMSAVMELPPELADELERFDELAAEFDQYQAEIAELGLGEIRLLDAADLGDGGVGLRIQLDLSGLFGPLLKLGEELAGDVSPGEELLELGISIEVYLFPRSERLLMVMVMEPLGQPYGVDGRGLAEIMDERAAEAF